MVGSVRWAPAFGELNGVAIAAPVNSLGALNSAAATLDNVEQAAIVCGRWRCWHTYGYYRPHRYWGWRRWRY